MIPTSWEWEWKVRLLSHSHKVGIYHGIPMKPYGSVLLIMVMVVFVGCGPALKKTPLSEEVQKTITQARNSLDVVKRLKIQEIYALDFQEAYNELIRAENYLQENRHDQAYLSALNSLAASQRIFRQLYRDKIAASDQETKEEIRTIFFNDPNNPLQEFLPILNEILDYADRIEGIDFTKVLEDFDKIAQIGDDARTMSKILIAEISFAPGEYDISGEKNRILRKFSEAIIADKQIYDGLYPDETFVIKTKIVGYADQVDFREGTGLMKKLMEGVQEPLPEYQIERRQFLNQRLSEFRARGASESLKQFIIQADQKFSQDQIEQEFVGLGEEIPPEVSSPYPLSDPRRRICKIYGYISLQWYRLQ